eukprot:gnl/MRDRNA2_/MRDRNA2_75833_c0_seq1.p1 gnl/MRDRNA2_/MRDRNA2_75833_c0~~gnl/MRDRNA2_/MRDRNA2_75833_c0_seq1.p1  ORF type:complete len:393 (+),score=44.27 gnl/MRDRNA2_/MRDRNA2_75833_c0_seq1:95-1273(+)
MAIPQIRVAVCMLGRIRGLAENAGNIISHLLEPLHADLYAYAPTMFLREASGMDVYSLFTMPRLMEFMTEEENVTASLWEAFQDQFGSDATPNWEKMKLVQGNWIGGIEEGAARELRRGTGLNQMYAFKRCFETMEAKERAGIEKYEWMVKSRFDFVWEVPHLPLELFSRDAVWIPEVHDWGGVNDRHALIPRGYDTAKLSSTYDPSQLYFNAWRTLLDGKAMDWIWSNFADVSVCEKDIGRELVRPPCTNHEFWLYMRLSMASVPISRYPNLAWTKCANVSALRWKGTQHNQEECLSKRRPYRYAFEHASAVAMRRCLSRDTDKVSRFGTGTSWNGRKPADRKALESLRARARLCYCNEQGITTSVPLSGSKSLDDRQLRAGKAWDSFCNV